MTVIAERRYGVPSYINIFQLKADKIAKLENQSFLFSVDQQV